MATLRSWMVTLLQLATMAFALLALWVVVESTRLTMGKGNGPEVFVVLLGLFAVGAFFAMGVNLLGRLGVLKPVAKR